MRKIISVLLFACFLFSTVLPVNAQRINIPPSAFTETFDDTRSLGNDGQYVWGGPMIAPVYLPDGATLRKMKVIYIDNFNLAEVMVQLYRVNMYTGTKVLIFQVFSHLWAGDSPDIASMSTSSCANSNWKKVNNGGYQYFLIFNPYGGNGSLQLHGVTLAFNPTTP